jgi:hypothetical protein
MGRKKGDHMSVLAKNRLTKTGKVIKKIPKDVTKRERRKLKKLAQKVEAGYMTAEDYDNQYRSWRGDKKRYNAYRTLKSMDSYKRRQSSWTKNKEKS